MKGKTLVTGFVRTIPLLLAGLLGAIAYGPPVEGKRGDADRLPSPSFAEARKEFLELSRGK